MNIARRGDHGKEKDGGVIGRALNFFLFGIQFI